MTKQARHLVALIGWISTGPGQSGESSRSHWPMPVTLVCFGTSGVCPGCCRPFSPFWHRPFFCLARFVFRFFLFLLFSTFNNITESTSSALRARLLLFFLFSRLLSLSLVGARFILSLAASLSVHSLLCLIDARNLTRSLSSSP